MFINSLTDKNLILLLGKKHFSDLKISIGLNMRFPQILSSSRVTYLNNVAAFDHLSNSCIVYMFA